MNAAWLDGRPTESLLLTDRGLHYGDGLFETLPVLVGRIPLLDAHLERFRAGCLRMGFPLPAEEVLRGELRAASAGQARAVLKLMITRGSGGRGYRPPAKPSATRILLRYPWPEYPAAWAEQGVCLRVCKTRLGTNPALAGLKHLNRLEQVLARSEWTEDQAFQEGLMLDGEGIVVEGTMTNVFASPGEGLLLTPDLSRAGVAGVMRGHLIEQAKHAGVRVDQQRFDLTEILEKREIFLCNSLIGVWPVAELDGRHYAPGPMTRLAQSWAAAE